MLCYSHIGGEGGIQTPGAVTRTPDFESGTFGRSVTSPLGRHYIEVLGVKLERKKQMHTEEPIRHASALIGFAMILGLLESNKAAYPAPESVFDPDSSIWETYECPAGSL